MAAEAVAAATIEILLEKMLTLSAEQIGLVWNFKDDLKKLQKTISMVKAFLHDAEEKQVTAHAVKIWLRNLEDLAFEADNVFSEINYRLLSKKVRATKKEKVKSFFSCSSKNPIAHRLKLGHRIKDINEKLKSIHQEARDLGLQEIAARAPVYASETTQTDSVSEDPIFHGRKEEVSSIVVTLITTEPKLSVLPIVGMGGLGKTTLARKVFNHEQIKSHFGDKQRVWVHVPRIFDEVVLFERILTSMGTESHAPQGNREALLKKLQQHFGAKKYLLVLDDVWNEDREKWDGFVNSLSGISSATGNCMIVTTRKHETASIVNTLHVHQLKCLSKDECWSIIHAKAFIGAGDDTSEFQVTGINIARKCQGLPLAAQIVGGLLRGKSKDEWMSIEKNWLSDFGDGENPMPRILKLSYDNLSSSSLKKCFAYCSIFRKGYAIEKKQLVELWMAEGFLQIDPQRSNIDMETTGNKLFNSLLLNSLLQVARSDDHGNVTHCNMHDLVHDLAFSILHENDNITDGVCQGRYVGYKSNGDGFLSIAKGQERYVRTLFFNGKISDIRFSDFESLRTLTLVTEIRYPNDLPNSIRKLKHLRYLDISETGIEYLPDSIGDLYHLQTLRANIFLEKLPNSWSSLISSRHLYISRYSTLPPEMGKLTSLQTFPGKFHVRNKEGCKISGLGNLKDLKGKLEIHGLENVRDKTEAMSAGLSQKSGIYELRLVWDKSREGDEANDESVLEGLQPHSNLKKLKICGFKGESLSLWEGLTNLVEIKLEKCSELKCLPDWLFSNNHNLTMLEILDCPEMTHLVPHLGGGGAPSLLRKLKIKDCRSLRELPDDLHSLSSLEVLKIKGCPDLKSIPYYPISSEGQQQQLPVELSSITPSQNLVMLIECLYQMPHFEDLYISVGCPHFACRGKMYYLHWIMKPLSDCDNVSFNETVGALSDCDNVSFNETVGAIMLPQLISLQRLFMVGKEDWDSLPHQLQHLTSLESLSLRDFGIEALPEWFGNLYSLRELILWDCKKLRHLPSKQAMRRLSNLWIWGCPLLLKEESRSNNNNDEVPQIVDSEWPNISHIPTIDVNNHRISSDE